MSETGKSDGTGVNGNVFALFDQAAIANPSRTFLVVEGGTRLTYGDMLAETGRAAA